MDVQVDVDDGVAIVPRAQLVVDRRRTFIQVRRTVELHEALSTLAALGVRKLGYRFCFYDCGSVIREFTARRGGGRDPSLLPAIKAARERLSQLLADAILEATEESMGIDHELHYDCEAAFKPGTGSWELSGRGRAYEIDPDLCDVGITFE